MFSVPSWLGGRRVEKEVKKSTRKRTSILKLEALEDRLTPSHNRYMNLYWEPVETDPTGRQIQFHFQDGWRRSAFSGSGGDGYAVVGDIISNSDYLYFGDGQSVRVSERVLSYNLLEDWIFTEAVTQIAGVWTEGITHTYATAGNYTSTISGCCRIGSLSNNSGDNYKSETIVNAGSPIRNHAPVTSLAPIVQVSDNSIVAFPIPASDPDGYPLTFRVATAAEALGGGTYTIPPGLTIDQNTGVVNWDIRNTVQPTVNIGDYWTLQVIVEDYDDFNTLVSKTPLDFILQVVDTTTNQAPVFDTPPTPTTVNVVVGQTLTFTVEASDPNPSNTVTLFALNPPTGMTPSVVAPTGGPANAYALQYTWVPNAIGSRVVNFQATDSFGLTTLKAVTINITPPPPGVTIVESTGNTTVSEAGANDTYTVFLNTLPTDFTIVTITPGAQVTVSPTTLTFFPASYNTPQTITVTAVDDALFESAHTGVITGTTSSNDLLYTGIILTPVTANIIDNDFPGVQIIPSGVSTDVAEGGQGGPLTDDYTVVLRTQPSANVIVTLAPSSQITVSPTRLTFTPATWNQAQQVVVTAVDDFIAEGAHTGLVGHTASSTDGNYSGLGIASLTVNIVDNDFPGATILETGINTKATEGAAFDTYTISLNTPPTADVFITLTPDSQVTIAPAVLTFTSSTWNVKQTITVTAVDDTLTEAAQHAGVITHTASSSDPQYNGVGIASMNAIVVDNDPPPGVNVKETTPPTTIVEGMTRSYTLVLNSIPTGDVVVDLTADAEVTVTPTSVTFTPSTWNVPRPINVLANEDFTAQGNRLSITTHAVTSTDPLYNGIVTADLNANIVDNDGNTVSGTRSADQIAVAASADGTQIVVSVNGKITAFDISIPQLLILAGDGNDSIQVSDPSLPVVVYGGNGTDKLFVNGRVAAPNTFVADSNVVLLNSIAVSMVQIETLYLDGGSAGNTFTFGATPAFPTVVKGDLGIDTIVGPDVTNTWKITATNAGTLNTSISFLSVENLTGGSGKDTYLPASGKGITGKFDGGAGSNVLDYSAFSSAVAFDLTAETATLTGGYDNVTTFKGGRGKDSLLAGVDNTWNITALNTGDINSTSFFQGIENLTGGAGIDGFVINKNASVTGKIDGGAGGGDFVSYANFGATKAATINLQAKTATATGGFANLESYIGTTGNKDVLIGANGTNSWVLNGSNAGTVNGAGFSGFENLTGGTLVDTFYLANFGDWSGLVNGGTGTDKLVANAAGNNVYIIKSLNAGTLNGKKFSNVEQRT